MAGTLVRDLRADLDADPSGFNKGFKSAEQSARIFEKALKEQEAAAKAHQQQLDKVGAVAVTMGGALVAGFAKAAASAMDFDKQISAVAAASGASAGEMEKLRTAALQAGKDTAFSATEAAQAETELAKAGLSSADIIGGALKGSLNLAAAGQLDLGEAATMTAQAMAMFNLKGKDSGHIADVLSAGANKSTATVGTLSEALRQGGLVASQMGLSFEETVGTLAAFDQNALKGSDAGTSLKTMLLSLANPTSQAKNLMQTLGVSAYDAGGNFVGMAAFAGQLQAALSGMSQEQRDATLAQIFGTDAVRAANIVYKLGEQGVRQWTGAVNDSGNASRTAATLTDNLAGDLEKLKGALETALIQGGSGATSALRGLTQAATGAVDLFTELPQPVQATLSVIGGLAGVVTAAAGAFVIGAPKVTAFKEALNDMGPRAQKFGSAISGVGSFLAGPWGIAIGAAVIGMGYFAQKHAEAEQRVADLTEAIKADSGAIGENTRAKVVNRLESDGLLEIAQKLGIDLNLVTEAALGNKDALAQVNRQIAASAGPADSFHTKVRSLADGTKVLSGDQMRLQTALGGVNSDLAESVKSFQRTETAEKGTAAGAQQAGSVMTATGEQAAAAAARTLASWSQAYSGFASMTGAISSLESASSGGGGGRSGRDLAQVYRDNAEKIKRAQRDVADAHERAADQITKANQRVRDSQEALAEAVQDAARKERDAARSVDDARRRAAEVAAESGRKIAAAAQNVSDAEVEAAAREVDAERKLQLAHQRTADAVQDLTAAREQAVQRMEDLTRSEAAGALDEEAAGLAIERARQRMEQVNADSRSSDLDRREADLAFRQAVARLDEIKRRNEELRDEVAKANTAGVEGSAEVVAAKKKIADAQRAEQEAEEALAKTRADGARSVQQAEQALADARAEAARQQADADRTLAKAQEDLVRAHADGAKDILKAKRDITDAVKEAAKANRDAARDISDAEEALRKTRRDAADDVIKANDEVGSSWGGLGSKVAITTTQYLAELEKQVKAQEDWAKNLVSLAGRVPDDMLQELAELGPGGARVVALAAQMSEPELRKFIDLHGRSGKEAGDVFAKNLAEAGPILREIARTRGAEVADKVREGMDGGRTSVYDSARKLGIDIDKGIGPGRTVKIGIDDSQARAQFNKLISDMKAAAAAGVAVGVTVGAASANGNIFLPGGAVASFAGGGEHHTAQISGPVTRVWSEPETGGEGYIPLALSKRNQSEQILGKIAGMFGGAYVKRTSTGPPGSIGGVGPAGGISVGQITLQFADDRDMYAKGQEFAAGLREYVRRGGVLPS